MAKPTYSDELSLDLSSDGGVLSDSDIDIDPALGSSRASLPHHDFDDDSFDDDDFPEPVIFSSDDEFLGDDDLGEGYNFRETLKAASGFKLRKKPTSKQYARRRLIRDTHRDLDPEVRDFLSKANEAFVKQDLKTAKKYYEEVIQRDSKNFNAYKTLGEINQMQGNKNRCCNLWFVAAQIRPWDGHFWGSVAELSSELGHTDQAIYCYNHAIAAKHLGNNPQHILERSLLYKQKKQYGRALEGFQKVHQIYPTDSSIIKHLASVYVEQKRLNDAISLYMRILDHNMHPAPHTNQYPRFTWSELNILCELYITQHSWRVGIKVIKLVARWMQKRMNEMWWDDQDDDAEFDGRRPAVVVKKSPGQYDECMGKPHDLPIDIRYKLGYFRLELDQKEEALVHFEFLFTQERAEVADLFFEAGRTLEAQGHYEEALRYMKELALVDNSSDLGMLMGKCYLEVGDYDNAKNTLFHVLKSEPHNVDLKLTLIEALYHTGDMETAAKLMEEVSSAQGKNEPEGDIPPQMDDENLALIRNTNYYKNVRSKKLTEEERIEIENNATRLVTDKFNRMQRLQEAIASGHKVAASAWMKIASQLIEMFMGVRSFFPKNRKTTFKGIVMYKRRKHMAIDDKLARLYNLYEGITENDNARMELTSLKEFRGLSYDEWLYVFVQYAFLLRHFESNIDEAIQLLEVALDVSVFVQDKTRSMLLRIARLALGMLQEDHVTVSNNVRYLLTSSQFSPTIYDFFMCCFGSGVGAWAAFSNYNHQKYFLRHLKAFDSLLTSSKVSGSAQVTVDTTNVSFTREHPQLLYIYACLLGSNRTFSSSIVYLTRAYREYNEDPTLCFMLGLAHVHRSMQRNSNNRHLQLLQGISYLLEYKTAREVNATDYEKQEIEYNFGRMFHMLGLSTLAVKHYNNVLDFHEKLNDETYDMLMEAAYNLSLIYTINGNTQMTKYISEKYLTI